ncbi:MAG: AAA family ATPase [Chloroflexi bacterium]|nr:AAA family ATPase [Chloroflexota bacterium]
MATNAAVTPSVRVLDALEVEVGGKTVDLGGPLQRAVLALLLVERGGVVSIDRLLDQLWRGQPPPRAIASLQAYVSNLRRVLEPGRTLRTPATLLASKPPGYALLLPSQAVDAWRFESLLNAALQVAPHAPELARSQLEEALALWRGPAYAEFADEHWAVAEVARLTELHLTAEEAWVESLLWTGAAAQAAPVADVLTRQQPLREERWRLLALALWASERQADALAALRRAQAVLLEELGLDPGPALTDLEGAILAQRQDVLRSALAAPGAVGEPLAVSFPKPTAVRYDTAPEKAPDEPFVGRVEELARIASAAAAARRTGGVVLITADAGGGKSTLLARAAAELTAEGWTVVAGHCPETDAVPPGWPWAEALRDLAVHAPPGVHAAVVGPLLDSAAQPPSADASTARFMLHQSVIGWLRAAATNRPLALVLDDLHNADAETLSLLEAVCSELQGYPALLLAAHRPAETSTALEKTLAVLARCSPCRLGLSGLADAEAAMLVSSRCGGPADPHIVATLVERTGGNPFYLRESAELLASEGALVAVSEVPEGVRDVLRRRLSRLPPPAVAVLRLAAVVGRDADVEIVVDAADTDEDGVVDGLEVAVMAGLLTEPAPGRVRFVHALVRDTVYTDLTELRRARMHARVASALRRRHPDDVTALAHHYARAGSAETAPSAVEYGIRAAELADRRYSYDNAVGLLSQAADACERLAGPAAEVTERRVDLLGRLLRAQVRAGRIGDARLTRLRAVQVAESAGRDDLTLAAFTAWSEPSPWHTRPYGLIDEPVVSALTRLLRRADLDAATRCKLLAALVAELNGEDDPRPARAAAEALAIARSLADPDLLLAALSASTDALDYEREADRRAALAAELGALAEERGVPAYQWGAEYQTTAAAATRSEPEVFRRHLERGQRLADQYQLTEPQTAQLCARAMLAHIEGRFADARRHYTEAAEQMGRNGSLHTDSFYKLALLTVAFSEGSVAQAEPLAREAHELIGPLAADVWAATLAASNRLDEASAAFAGRAPIRRDFFYSLLATFRARAVIGLGARAEAMPLIADLAPVAGMLAGAASASLVMQPVDLTLAELYLLVGKPEQAAVHFRLAEQVAQRWNSAHWAARASTARAATGPLRATGLRPERR